MILYPGLLCFPLPCLFFIPPPHPRRKSHIIIEQFGFKGTFNSHLDQLTCNEQGHLQLRQGVQSFSQPDLEHFQGWGIYDFPAQPVPAFHHLIVKKNFLFASYLNLLSFSLKPLPLVLLLEAQLKSLSSFFLQAPCTYWKVAVRSLLSLSSPGWTTSFLFKEEVLQPSEHSCGSPRDLLQQVHISPVLRAPEMNAELQMG